MNFNENYLELLSKTPHRSFKQIKVENCEYADYIEGGKNCYYVFDAGEVEDVYYSDWIAFSKNCCDCSHSLMMELSYECIDCQECYNSNFLLDCSNMTDCNFCFSCKSCKNCFLCSGIKQKKYCIFNKEHSENDYYEKIAHLKKEGISKLIDLLNEFNLNVPRINMHLVNCENCSGDFITDSKNVYHSFGIFKEQDSGYVIEYFDLSAARQVL